MRTEHDIMTNVMAFICRICPFCVCARWWPNSRYAHALRKIEMSCPACQAYAKQRQMNAKENSASQ
ncbi:MAG: hypothetical protein PHR77_16350 [Kiritimatiellae bacterium]|nr:hypothetical protein [Kiritimatiellia bacterium]MDD5522186.1 hypothetical protein [Kiritimatiellia bacterium]